MFGDIQVVFMFRSVKGRDDWVICYGVQLVKIIVVVKNIVIGKIIVGID